MTDQTSPTIPENTEVVVIGSGIGGLSCAAILARYGFAVTVCESHTIPGGAAHGFERNGYIFDSGPSLYSGMSDSPSTNPLKQVLDAIGEDISWKTYDVWGCRLPEGDFDTSVGADQFCDVLMRLRGPEAVKEWRELQRVMAPLKDAAVALPMAAMRYDLGAIFTMGRFALPLLQSVPYASKLTGAFGPIMDEVVTDPFIRNWLDMLCFLLSGLPASGTSAAAVAFMFAEWYRPNVVLDYPVGGSAAMVEAMVRGLKRYGGSLRLGAHVEQVLVENNRAVGVRLRGGEEIRASKAVVSNASIWDTLKLVPLGALPQSFVKERSQTPECESFMHLHLGIDGAGLPEDMACHYICMDDWDKGITTPMNLIVMSIPTMLDPSLAPPGKHVIHVYTPGNEPYKIWEGFDRRSPEYTQLKAERAEAMWKALERVIPDVRSRCEVTLVGTPLTHERFLRCHRGSYGPAIPAGEGTFPSPQTPLAGLLCCGGSTFPGIGLPAVAASGMIAANTLTSVQKHWQMLDDIGCQV